MNKLEEVRRNLITANHILHNHNNLDAYGHISARHPDDSGKYLLSASIAPALVANANDLIEYTVSDSTPLNPDAPRGYIERYIHGEIYKLFPSVNSVVHSHSFDVLPYTITGVPLKPVYHMAGFLGQETPVWDIAELYNGSQPQDLLVRSASLGASLASALKKPESEAKEGTPSDPDYAAVLMRRHGFTTYGVDIKEAVYRAIFTQSNARAQTASIVLSRSANTVSQQICGNSELAFEPLTEKMTTDCATTMSGTVQRPWGLWVREVEVNPLYVNNVGRG